MAIELTPEQARGARQENGGLRLIDPESHQEYVLVPAELYERLRHVLADASSVADAYPAIDRSFAPGWDDPRMDDYDRCDELKK